MEQITKLDYLKIIATNIKEICEDLMDISSNGIVLNLGVGKMHTNAEEMLRFLNTEFETKEV